MEYPDDYITTMRVCCEKGGYCGMSRSLMVDFILFSLLPYFSFSFSFIFYFLFLEQLGLGFISHAVTSVTN